MTTSDENECLAALLDRLHASELSLAGALPNKDYHLILSPNHIYHATQLIRIAQVEVKSPAIFTVFGVLSDSPVVGFLRLAAPRWHGHGPTGSKLSVRYGEQLLALSRALKSVGMATPLVGNEEITLLYSSSDKVVVGDVVIAQASLMIHSDTCRHKSLSPYSLIALRLNSFPADSIL